MHSYLRNCCREKGNLTSVLTFNLSEKQIQGSVSGRAYDMYHMHTLSNLKAETNF